MSGTLQPALVTFNATKNYTFSGSGVLTGTNALIKSNTGTLTLSATNSYTGGTTVNGGSLTFSIGAAIPSTGTLTLNNTGAVTVVSANGLPNILVNGTNSITGNGNSGTGAATLDVEGTLTLLVSGGSKVFDLTGTMTGGGNLILGNPSAMTLRFNGTSGDGNAIFNLGMAANFASVRNGATAIALGGLVGGAAVTLQGASSANDVVTFTIGGANANMEFDGVIANGGFSGSPATVIVKIGTGTQIFTGANTYVGGTTINGGILQINNSSGSGTGSGAVTVASDGTLSGNGIISGAVTVNFGGALAPGNPLGTLTVSNNLALANGSTTFIQVQHSPLTNNAAKISGTLTEGGILNVTNIGGALNNGDNFQLFSAANYSGSFTNLILPPLNGNLVWNTNTLKNFGSLSVVALTSPTFSSFKIVGGNLIVTGSGGVNNWPYYLLASTNLASAQWNIVVTNQFDTNGNFNLTNAIDASQPQTFYKLQLQ